MTHDVLASEVPVLGAPSLKDNLAYTIDQAGSLSGIGRSALYIAVRDGRLPARKCGRRTVVLKAELKAFLDALPLHNRAREA